MSTTERNTQSLKEDFEEFKENMDDMNETFQETHKQIS